MEPETALHPGRKRSSLLARFTVPIGACVLGALAAGGFVAEAGTRNARAQETASAPPPADLAATIARLEAETKRLGALVPNQPTVMTHVAYHFTNLWFAAQRGNWPLAGYYLGEVRSNLKWAARIRPVRETPAGEVDVAGIAEAVDNTELAALAAAVEAKDPAGFAHAYDDTITACYACHKAIGKPYLRPRRPAFPEVQAINLDPAARWPQ
jgi:hypothetical protein